MSARVIDGRAIAARIRAEVAADVAARVAAGRPRPGLATVLVGEDPASARYVAGKQRACAEVGIEGFSIELAADSSGAQVARRLHELNDDPAVSGILLQLPVPAHLDGPALTEMIRPDKDVDGLTAVSAGLLASGLPGLRPCTPAGVIELLRRSGATLDGADAVIVGRSSLVGRPLAQLLLVHDATVTVCHTHTRGLRSICRRADVLVSAAGRPRMIGADWIKPGATIIDVGITPTDDGLAGDVDFDAALDVAGAITPVPGGVGPMTIAMLLANTLRAAAAAP